MRTPTSCLRVRVAAPGRSSRGIERDVDGLATNRGEGVVETFRELMRVLYRSLDEKHDFSTKFGLSEDSFLKGVLANFGSGYGS